jgi:hypothetical protein
MANAPWTFQERALIVLALLRIWPDTRLVHMFSAPQQPLGVTPISPHGRQGLVCEKHVAIRSSREALPQ